MKIRNKGVNNQSGTFTQCIPKCNLGMRGWVMSYSQIPFGNERKMPYKMQFENEKYKREIL